MAEFKPASRRRQKARIALDGVAGVGKSKTGLGILRGLVGPQGRIAAIDTEHGALQRCYAGMFPSPVQPTGFDVIELVDFGVEFYMEAIQAAARARYDGLLIDSASHAWAGKGGILELVDRLKEGSDKKDAFGVGWRQATPLHTRFIEAILSAPMHVVTTMRTKADYVIEKDEQGKTKITKLGMAPIQRDGFDYEFDLIGHMDQDHTLTIGKARGVFDFLDGAVIAKPVPIRFGEQLLARLEEGEGEWEAPEFARKFKIGDRLIETKGVTYETYVQCGQVGAAYDKATAKGNARKELAERYKCAGMSGLTESQAIDFIVFMEQATAEAMAKIINKSEVKA